MMNKRGKIGSRMVRKKRGSERDVRFVCKGGMQVRGGSGVNWKVFQRHKIKLGETFADIA